MKREKIFDLAIRKAINSEVETFDLNKILQESLNRPNSESESFFDWLYDHKFEIIFSHEFAKAFFIPPSFGETTDKTYAAANFKNLYWKKKLQEMVVAKDPFLYLLKFL